MAKWYGVIGYAADVELEPGVWIEEIVEKNHYGDVNRNTRKLQNSGGVNDNVDISNEISIIADPYAVENFHRMRYAKFMGTAWKITNVEVQYPRLILSMGGVYNVPQT